MSVEESAYKRFFWVLTAGAVSVVGLGAYQVITMGNQVGHLATSINKMEAGIATLQSQVQSVTTTGAIVAEQVRLNQAQQDQITELRIWRATIESKMPTK